MTLYFLVWLHTAYTCPWGLSQAPKLVKDLLCKPQAQINYLPPTSRLKDSLKPINQDMEAYQLFELKAARIKPLKVIFTPEVKP